MLVLSRKVGEKVIISGDITVTVVEVSGNRVRLGIDAPGHVRVLRSELLAHQYGPRQNKEIDPDYVPASAAWADKETAAAFALSD